MAQKKITDYQLISAITSTVNFFVDDLTQNYRATAAQIKTYVLSTGVITTAMIDALAVTAEKIAAGAVTDAKTSFTKPTVQRFLSGSGTYTTPAGVKYIKVKMAGGGGGGGVGGVNTGTASTDGGDSTFGSSLLIAAGGHGGGYQGDYVSNFGGAATVNSPAIALVAITGGSGQGTLRDTGVPGGVGGSNAFGGAGMSRAFSPGSDAAPNTGAGGGGGGSASGDGAYTGSGGGAGGYLEALITSPSATYTYAVGAKGTKGVGGDRNGGDGALGVIIVEEYYQ